MIPVEELKKEPQMINERMRLKLKKTIIRNHRQIGLLPKEGSRMETVEGEVSGDRKKMHPGV